MATAGDIAGASGQKVPATSCVSDSLDYIPSGVSSGLQGAATHTHYEKEVGQSFGGGNNLSQGSFPHGTAGDICGASGNKVPATSQTTDQLDKLDSGVSSGFQGAETHTHFEKEVGQSFGGDNLSQGNFPHGTAGDICGASGYKVPATSGTTDQLDKLDSGISSGLQGAQTHTHFEKEVGQSFGGGNLPQDNFPHGTAGDICGASGNKVPATSQTTDQLDKLYSGVSSDFQGAETHTHFEKEVGQSFGQGQQFEKSFPHGTAGDICGASGTKVPATSGTTDKLDKLESGISSYN